ncbi:MAG TPA: hypothetical protein VM290_03060 [Gaiellaceae bacterium]|nr:hypothetical protein [Gaiellaceae bacterium]
MDAYSALTTIATVLLLVALGVAVWVWLAYAHWSELRFRHTQQRIRAYDVVAALRERGDEATASARAAFLRALATFAAVVVVAVALLELRERV